MIDAMEILHSSHMTGLLPNGGVVVANAELHKIEGQEFYFSITTDSGADCESILESDLGEIEEVRLLAQLHLSDINGIPMHAVANAEFWIEKRDRQRLASHLRISIEKADSLIADCEWYPGRRDRIAMVVADFIPTLKDRWAKEAQRAAQFLREHPVLITPGWSKERAKKSPFEYSLIRFGKDVLPIVEWETEGKMIYVVCGPSHRFTVFADKKTAGRSAKEHYERMAKDEPKELESLVGVENLVKWGLGKPASPGSVPVSSLKEWLNLWTDHPEDHFATFDGKELEADLSAPFARTVGISVRPKEAWTRVVAYRR